MKYRGRIVDNPNSAPPDDAIGRLETLLGAKLPADYLTFLRCCNGGHVDYEIPVTFEDGSSEPGTG
jgi:hypothetical protein